MDKVRDEEITLYHNKKLNARIQNHQNRKGANPIKEEADGEIDDASVS
jgi:hypothetical protein